jgi:predicted dehydrogenase
LRALSGVELTGFVETRLDRALEVEKELGVKAHPSLDSLLDASDAVIVVVPTSAHFSVASAAIERGKHVFIEKPITTTLEEADALLALARSKGVIVQIGHIERFNQAVRAALPHVNKPRFIDSERLAPFSPRGSDVAVVLDLMIHDIDLLLTLVGTDAKEISRWRSRAYSDARHRQRTRHLLVGGRSEHHVQPHLTGKKAKDPNLPAERISIAGPRVRQRRILSAAIGHRSILDPLGPRRHHRFCGSYQAGGPPW